MSLASKILIRLKSKQMAWTRLPFSGWEPQQPKKASEISRYSRHLSNIGAYQCLMIISRNTITCLKIRTLILMPSKFIRTRQHSRKTLTKWVTVFFCHLLPWKEGIVAMVVIPLPTPCHIIIFLSVADTHLTMKRKRRCRFKNPKWTPTSSLQSEWDSPRSSLMILWHIHLLVRWVVPAVLLRWIKIWPQVSNQISLPKLLPKCLNFVAVESKINHWGNPRSLKDLAQGTLIPQILKWSPKRWLQAAPTSSEWQLDPKQLCQLIDKWIQVSHFWISLMRLPVKHNMV